MANTIKKYKITQLQANDTLLELHPETDADIVNYSGNIGGTTVTTVKGALDKIATGIGVTGVKGDAENAFRTGNVNLTPANLGAVAESVTSNNKTTSITRRASNNGIEIKTTSTGGGGAIGDVVVNNTGIFLGYDITGVEASLEFKWDDLESNPIIEVAQTNENSPSDSFSFDLLKLKPFAGKSVSTGKPSALSTDVQIPTAAAVWLGLEDRAPLASPALTGTPTAPTATKGTNNTQIATTAFVMSAFEAADAMVYKGTQAGGSTGAYGALTPAANKGDTYKVSAAGKIDGVAVEVGDMLICNTDETAAATTSNYTTIKANWDFIQTNIDGAVIGPISATDSHIALFDGNTGKIIKDSGFTIGKSVPSDAVFTDTNTWREIQTGSEVSGNTLLASNSNLAFRFLTDTDNSPTIRTNVYDYTSSGFKGISFDVRSGIGDVIDLYVDYKTQNYVLAAPSSEDGVPSFRALVAADIPDLSATYQPKDADLTAIGALTGTSGLLKKTAANTWALDTNAYITGNQTITLSGAVTGSGTTSIVTTLANSGVTAGSYSAVTVNAKGIVTAGGQILEVGMAVTDAAYNEMSAAEKAYYSSTSTGGYHKQVAPHTTLAEGGLFFQEI